MSFQLQSFLKCKEPVKNPSINNCVDTDSYHNCVEVHNNYLILSDKCSLKCLSPNWLYLRVTEPAAFPVNTEIEAVVLRSSEIRMLRALFVNTLQCAKQLLGFGNIFSL